MVFWVLRCCLGLDVLVWVCEFELYVLFGLLFIWLVCIACGLCGFVVYLVSLTCYDLLI